MFPVGQPENMRKLLLNGCDTARVFTADDTRNRLWEVGMNFLHPLSAADNIDGNVRINITQHVVVQVNDLIDFQNIFFPILAAGGVFDDRHLTFQLIQAQIPVEVAKKLPIMY